ncbi:MAG: glycosyltransferase [Halobacteriales archaeon]|nr:glycosyltransferase [Halobacteriales archaeon]
MSARTTFLAFLEVTGVFVLGYYLLINFNYLFIHAMGLLELRDEVREASWEPLYEPFTTPFLPGIAIVVPAYNEAGVIVESVKSLLTVNYPDKEIVVVNDGSSDGTLDRLQQAYTLEPVDAEIPFDLPSERVRNVYRSADYDDLLVVDKENGGKSDALNAGIWLTDQELFCAIDADSIIDRDGLLEIVRPFLEYPRTMVAVGGTVRVANECEIEHGQIVDVDLDRKRLVALQAMEYLRAFYSGRLGLSRLKGLILISGAFGVFRTEAIREIGGYREDTITEDFDLLVRLHRHFINDDRDYRVDFLPQPVIWTEVPETRRVLSRQRRRWYRGMVETLWTNRDMIGNPRYGRIGVYALPFFLFGEMLGPLIEGLGYLIIPLAVFFGAINWPFFALFFVVTTGFGVFLSWFGLFSEVTSFRRYEQPREILRLMWDGVLENFGYRQWKTIVAWRGLFEYFRGVQSWGVMERSGFGDGTGETVTTTEDRTPAVVAMADKIDDDDIIESTDGFHYPFSDRTTPPATDRSAADGFVWQNTDDAVEADPSKEDSE